MTARPSVPQNAERQPSVSHTVNPSRACAAQTYSPQFEKLRNATPRAPEATATRFPVPTSHTATPLRSRDPAASRRPSGDHATVSYGGGAPTDRADRAEREDARPFSNFSRRAKKGVSVHRRREEEPRQRRSAARAVSETARAAFASPVETPACRNGSRSATGGASSQSS